MWILDYLPEWLLHWLVIGGALGVIASLILEFMPFVKTYKIVIQVVSVLVLALGLWVEGGLSEKSVWEGRVSVAEKKAAEAEAKGAKETIKIVEKLVYRNKIIIQKGDDVIQYIDREVVKYDHICPIPEVVIKAHDAAALGVTIDELTK